MRSGGRTRWPAAHRLPLLACLLSVVIGCTTGFALGAEHARRDSARVLVAANRFERLLDDLERGQLGYAATGDDGSLGPWNAARAGFSRQAALLERLADDDGPEQGRRAREIVRSATSYLREEAEPFVRTARRDRERARTAVARAEGQHRIDAIRRQIDRFTEVQHRLAVLHERDAVPAVRRMIAATAGASGSFLLAVLLLGYVRRGRERDAARPVPDVDGLVRSRTGPGEEHRRAGKRAALRSVTGLLARDAPPAEVFARTAAEMGRVLGAEHAMICRYEPDGTATVVGHWSTAGAPAVMPPLGGRWPVEDETVTDLVHRTGRPARQRADVPAVGRIGAWLRAARIERMTGYPVVAGDRLWGMAAVLAREPGPWPADPEPVLGEFAGLLGIAVADAGHRAELGASRLRLVEATDATRRRIERALHERTQQRLVTVGLELGAAEASVPPSLSRLREQLAGAARDVTEIVDDLQGIARELHPAFLGRSGLTAALRALARRVAVPVELDVRAERPLPRTIALTVYYLVAEALANAVAHAHASVVRVRLDLAGPVNLMVHDDGIGGARPRPGSVLSGLRDRAEALGGRFTIDSPAGGGTSLRVSLPAGEPTPAGTPPDAS